VLRARILVMTLVLAGCGAAVVAPSKPVVRAPVAKVEVVAPPPLAEGPAVVQRETVLRIDEADGIEIGRAFAGAHVRVVHVVGAAAEVEVPDVKRHAWVDASALGAREVPLVEPPLEGRTVRDFYSHVMERRGDDHAFFYTRCGPLQILEQATGTSRVAQRFDGFEIVGWSELPIRGSRGDFPCPARIAETGTPVGFTPSRQVDVASVLRADRTVHWLGENEDGSFTCADWHVTKKGELRHAGRSSETTYTIEREGSRVALLGPTVRTGKSESSSYGCADVYRAVDLDGDRLVLVPHQAGWRPISAYHPDDVEVWYLSESACRAAATRASSAPTTVATSSIPVHTGC
jgi:hypothetical protein